MQYTTIQYNTIQYNTIQYSTIQYSTLHYNTGTVRLVQYNAILTVHYNTLHHRKFDPAHIVYMYMKAAQAGINQCAVRRAVGNVRKAAPERLKVMLLEAGRNSSRRAGKF
jgi:hypothetical protein